MPRKRTYRKKGRRATFATKVKNVLYKELETRRAVHTLANTITNTVDTSEMTDISQGDGEQNRQGNEVICRSIAGRLVAKKHASASNTVLRMVLYTPRDADTLLTTLDTTSRIDKDSYTVHVDKLYTLYADKPTAIMKLGHKYYNKKIKGMKTTYASSTAGDITRNPVCLAIVSDEATNGPSVNGDVTLYFKDP